MQTSTPRGLNSEPNVVPMIDVLLVLLIIFILMNVPRVKHWLDIRLPPESSSAPGSPSIVLSVGPGPTYEINSRRISPVNIKGELAHIYRDRPEKVIFISGDPKARYHEVISAFDIARGAGVRVAGLKPHP